MDDVFFLLNGSRDQLERFVEYLNDCHELIRFSLEVNAEVFHVKVKKSENNMLSAALFSKSIDRNNLLRRDMDHKDS